MYDPEFPVTPELQSLLGEVGLEVGSGMVVDPVNHSGTDEDKVAVPYYPPHPITDQVALTVFPGPRPLELLGKIPGIEATTLVSTSQESYVRPIATSTALASTQPAVPPEPKAAPGHGPADLGCRAAGQLAKRGASGRAEAVPPCPGRQRQLRHQRILSLCIEWRPRRFDAPLARRRPGNAQTETGHLHHARSPAHASRDAAHVLPDRNPAAASR